MRAARAICASLCLLSLVAVACYERHSRQVCAEGDVDTCTCPSGASGTRACVEDGSRWSPCDCGGPDADVDIDIDTDVDVDTDTDIDWDSDVVHLTTRVDLLFVVDNSNSMGEEQAELAYRFADFVQELLSPSADPETGLVPPAVEDLHVGVVSTDMGTGGYTVMTCPNPMLGDNGVLQNRGMIEDCFPSYSAEDCSRAACPWLLHSEGHPNDGTEPDNPPIWEDFACIASLGVGGCGMEQQLEASLVALTTQTARGHANEGFLRDDSVLAVVYVTDEDDCSSGDPELFNPARNDDLGPLNVRCHLQPGMLYPITRYTDGLLSLRPGAPDLVVVAAIVGIPVDGTWDVGDPLDELRALNRVDPSDPGRLLPTCRTDWGLAYAPVRIVDLAYRFGRNGVLDSICRSDYGVALDRVAREIQRHLVQ